MCVQIIWRLRHRKNIPAGHVFAETELEVGEEGKTCLQVSSDQRICDGSVINYIEGDKTFTSALKEEGKMIISITKCDGKRASGSFEITLDNPYDNEENISISGLFTDLKYTIIDI